MKEVTKKTAAEKSDAKHKDNSNVPSADTNIFSGMQQEWKDRLNKCCAQENQIFRKAKSDSLKDETYKNGNANKELKYKLVLYKCKFGNDARIRGTGLRKTRTSRLGCKAFIQLNISKDRQNLIVTNCDLSHTNHNETKNELAKDKIYITLKNLTNMKASTKSVDGDNLKNAIDYLISEGADVDIHTEDNHFRGLFFCTKEMKKSFDSYPEMFIDGTYKLLQLDFTVVILMVEDSNSTSEVVAVGLLVTEDAENCEWFLNTFCKYHPESSKNIKCIMSDKDTTKRGVLEKNFVDVPLYICSFYTMQIFKRRTLNLKNKTECLEILQALVYSESAENYDYYYNKLCCAASGTSFLVYFNGKWHEIRSQWTEYGMIHGNMGKN
ncbi:hypothetical protein TSAR_012089 [Trichomalopsis sarcophagae]|uniref:Uncharacterized protein n=1 Tax=Trichomalopsis sarcophagae TaxID=543379 RepID=A0A232EDH0_9HYME|nr:hypothetical protein TSAR_012089 [Trichomalopsis sarcophagae]